MPIRGPRDIARARNEATPVRNRHTNAASQPANPEGPAGPGLLLPPCEPSSIGRPGRAAEGFALDLNDARVVAWPGDDIERTLVRDHDLAVRRRLRLGRAVRDHGEPDERRREEGGHDRQAGPAQALLGLPALPRRGRQRWAPAAALAGRPDT